MEIDVLAQGVSIGQEEKRAGDQALAHPRPQSTFHVTEKHFNRMAATL